MITDMDARMLAVKAYTNAPDDVLALLEQAIRYLGEQTGYDPLTIAEDAVQFVREEGASMDTLVYRLTPSVYAVCISPWHVATLTNRSACERLTVPPQR